MNSEENGFVDKPIDLRVVAATLSNFSNSASLEVEKIQTKPRFCSIAAKKAGAKSGF